MMQRVKSNSTLERMIATVGELPASPAVLTAVMGLTSNLDTKIADLSRVLAADQSLTAKVLKLSNSSFFGRAKGVKTLPEAILILGFATVRSLVVASSAHTLYNAGDRDPSKAKLWRHSFAAAVAARQIALALKHPEKEELFIAALLHDIGKLVLMLRLPGRYHEVVAEVERDGRPFVEIEERVLGFTHCDVAAILLEKWSFPGTLIEAIFGHHLLPECGQDGPVPPAYVIHLGNVMAKQLGNGFAEPAVDDLTALPSARVLGLDEDRLEEIRERLQEQYQSEIGVFEGS